MEAAHLEEIEDLFRRNREGWTTLPPIQGESEINVYAIWFEQTPHEVGVFRAAIWVNGAKTSVFQNVIKGLI